jgi:hypothetical protein
MAKQKLFIKVSDEGVPETHPIIEGNMADVFPNFDPNEPPKGFYRFIKEPVPTLAPDEKYDYLEYVFSPEWTKELNTPTWTEVHHVIKIEPEEKEKVINEFKSMNPDLQDWVFDEELQVLVPPVPKPQDGKNYYWNTDLKIWLPTMTEDYFDNMMEVAKELGYDLVNGRFGKANVSYDMVDNIINHMKSQGLDVSYELDPKKFADDDSELMKNTVIRRVEKQKDNF